VCSGTLPSSDSMYVAHCGQLLSCPNPHRAVSPCLSLARVTPPLVCVTIASAGVSAQQLDITSARLTATDVNAGMTTTYRLAARWEPSVIFGDTLSIEFPPGTTFGPSVTITFPNLGAVTCTPSPANYNISCPVPGAYSANDEPMPITNIINAPFEVAAMNTLRLHVHRLSQVYAYTAMTLPAILFGPITRFLLTPSQVTSGFTTNYLVSVNVFQRPAVNDRIVIGFPEGTSRLLNSPVVVSLSNDNRMTFKDCAVNEITLPEVRCRVDTVDNALTTGSQITYFVQNLRHGTNSTRAMATNLRYSILPAQRRRHHPRPRLVAMQTSPVV
jgi:hypothetical protein